MKLISCIAGLIGAGLLFFGPSAQAEPLTGTLKKIKDTGTITLGVRDSSMPFSYTTDSQLFQGYSVDLCMKAVFAIQKHLGMQNIKTVMSPVTSATRIPLLTNGTIDLECGSTTNNLERQKQVAFAPTMYIASVRLLAKKSANVRSLADLKGKTVVSTAGSTALKQVTVLNSNQALDAKIIAAKDHAEAFLMVETGRAVAFAMDDILLMSLAANARTPGDYEITKDPLSVEPYGIMLRRDDPAFKKLVDTAISNVFTSGEINTIYAKWFNNPIAPKGVSLNVAMSPNLRWVTGKPTDSGDPATYAAVPEAQKSMSKK